MKCGRCECIMPSYYQKCPVCNYKILLKEEFALQRKEEERAEPIHAEVVASQIEIGEIDE